MNKQSSSFPWVQQDQVSRAVKNRGDDPADTAFSVFLLGPAGRAFGKMLETYGTRVVFYMLDGDERFNRAATAAIESTTRWCR